MLSNDSALAEHAISVALKDFGEMPWPWLRDAIYGSGESNEGVASQMREMKSDLGSILDWGLGVPDQMVPRFVATCLGRDLLRSSMVRRLLVAHRTSTAADSATLLKFAEVLEVEADGASVETVANAAENMMWKPSTNRIKRLTELLGFPPRYAQAGTSDDRPTLEIVEPIKSLPDLLPFQQRVRDAVVEVLDNRGRAIVVMPTGSGKTMTSVEAVIHHLVSGGSPISQVVWLADRDELCEQAFQTFKSTLQHRSQEPVPLWRYWDGNALDLSVEDGNMVVPGIVVTSIQQIRMRFDRHDPTARHLLDSCKVMIIDEAHRNLEWNESIVRYLDENGSSPGIIGLTATPLRRERHEAGRLARIFDNNAIAPVEGGENDPKMVADSLTDAEILARRVDISASDLGLRLTIGGSSRSRIEEAYKVIIELRNRGAKSILAFAEDVVQSKRLAVAMSLNGVTARHLDAATPTMERREIIEGFRSGEVSVLVNYGILTTGFDAPNTDAIAIFRKTEDTDQPIIQQMVGRGLRGPKFGGTESCMVFIRGVG